MPVFIYDKDALQRVAWVEQDVWNIDATEWMSIKQARMGAAAFIRFLEAWNDLRASQLKEGSPLSLPGIPCPLLRDVYPLKSKWPTGGSTMLYGWWKWHRYMVELMTGEILFHRDFMEKKGGETFVCPIVEKYGFRIYPA